MNVQAFGSDQTEACTIARWAAIQSDPRFPPLVDAVAALRPEFADTTQPHHFDPTDPNGLNAALCTVRVFRPKIALEDSIGPHACSLEAAACA
jgi:hypothetical protein